MICQQLHGQCEVVRWVHKTRIAREVRGMEEVVTIRNNAPRVTCTSVAMAETSAISTGHDKGTDESPVSSGVGGQQSTMRAIRVACRVPHGTVAVSISILRVAADNC
mmetsp:Transcript_19808/g.40925  ORF Transcript_19808/g.40925 Transcript_19808/m.40925 type:complete len:107 (+) Transcript_19808:1247-1567(+)